MKFSTIIKGSVCVLGLVGVSNFFAAPAKADQAAARGAVTVVRPSGSSISVSGELVAPSGTQFAGPLAVTITTPSNPGLNTESLEGISIDPGEIAVSSAENGGTIEGAIAGLITDTALENGIVDVATYIRAYSAGGLE
ncbi:hypothetical protein H1Q63_35465 [Desmonostoc muscorum CCALA 125]|nr:hypothetical protein [Desmonostoc muscorum CCALA 125]